MLENLNYEQTYGSNFIRTPPSLPNLLALSLKQAENFTPKEPHILISIFSPLEAPTTPKLPTCNSRLEILSIDVYDYRKKHLELVDREKLFINGVMPPVFTKKEAEKIANFARKHLDHVELIAAHCYAGASRSTGVIAALASSLCAIDGPSLLPGHNDLIYEELIKVLPNENLKNSLDTNFP